MTARRLVPVSNSYYGNKIGFVRGLFIKYKGYANSILNMVFKFFDPDGFNRNGLNKTSGIGSRYKSVTYS
jgi:hypothetical protein